jgi:acyl-CoA synthetase (AMP-forming)/AMP-acid ligase II/thioesterase domain-containing protein
LTLSDLEDIYSIVSFWADKSPDSYAILDIDEVKITYHELFENIKYIGNHLNQMGIGNNDRVAVVLPNGPHLAVTFLGVSSFATFATLNPLYTVKEYEFFLSDLRAKAVIIDEEMVDALSAAEKLNINVLRLKESEASRLVSLSDEKVDTPRTTDFSKAEDIALILHTSGTTSRPKIVPLSQMNICKSAHNIKSTLRLTPHDRCLNVMPLFHIHGLIGATLSSICAGASIICSPGYRRGFIEWLRDFEATWYSAVPTIHHQILSLATENPGTLKDIRLRFIRSSSQSLPSKMMLNLEDTFNVPVIESYGMTEASHQMSSNQLPPGKRKPGTVGFPAGPDITILDQGGNELPRGQVGEISIKGANVTKGYENNPPANQKAFTNGWLRTGDEGYFDHEGFLVIKDRIKEIINRGGEKISPREIDEVILDHPKVRQVVTFPIPHPLYGEEIGAAIVPKENKITSREIQEHVARRLASFKVPRHISFMDEIPKGPTGKLQRIGLSERLGIEIKDTESEAHEYIPPKTKTEKYLKSLWEKALAVEKIGIRDNYFQLGGESLIAAEILSEIQKDRHIKRIPLVIFLYAPTIEEMAKILDNQEYDLPPASLVALQPEGTKPPIYCVHACKGEILFLKPLSIELGNDQPLYGLRAQGLDGGHPAIPTIEEMAKHYLNEIKAFQPNPPYLLAGAGVGGIIAIQMANLLKSENIDVDKVFLFDMQKWFHLDGTAPRGSLFNRLISRLSKGEFRQILRWIRNRLLQFYYKKAGIFLPGMRTQREVLRTIVNAASNHELNQYHGDTVLFISSSHPDPRYTIESRTRYWRDILKGNFKVHTIPGEHLNILKPPSVKIISEEIKTILARACIVS